MNFRALVGVLRVGVENAEPVFRFLLGVRGVLLRRLKLASSASKSSPSSSSAMGETLRSFSQSDSTSSSSSEFFLRRFRRPSGFSGAAGLVFFRVALVPFWTSSPIRKMLVSRPL